MLSVGSELHAQPSVTPRVSWSDRASCPAPTNLTEAVRALVGEGRHDDVQLGLQVRTLTEQAAQGVEVSLTARTDGEEYRRVLVVESCTAAHEAALLLVSLALAPSPNAEEPVVAAQDSRRAPRSISAGLGASVLGDLGTLPAAGAGIGLAGFLRRERLLLWVDARTLFARTARDADSGARARVDLWASAVGGALQFGAGRVRLGPSATFELGYLRARGAATAEARTTGAFWAMAAVGALLEVLPGGATSYRAQLEGGVPLRRPTFALEDGPGLHEPWPLVVRLTFSVAFRLGPKA